MGKASDPTDTEEMVTVLFSDCRLPLTLEYAAFGLGQEGVAMRSERLWILVEMHGLRLVVKGN